jgi:hypothetical protein
MGISHPLAASFFGEGWKDESNPKEMLTKLVLETKLLWIKCLLVALLRMKMAPQKDIGVSPYEMLYGIPYLGQHSGLPSFVTKDQFLRNYVLDLLLCHLLDNRICYLRHYCSNSQCTPTNLEITS